MQNLFISNSATTAGTHQGQRVIGWLRIRIPKIRKNKNVKRSIQISEANARTISLNSFADKLKFFQWQLNNLNLNNSVKALITTFFPLKTYYFMHHFRINFKAMVFFYRVCGIFTHDLRSMD